jgi:hypothetical protein
VRVASSTGTSLPNKVCVLVTAPLEGQEFSNVGARPDVFHPRSAILDNAFSPPTDSKGETTFANVTLRASSIRHMRLWAVCDGVVAGYENGGGNSIVFSARRSNDEANTLVATVVTQPSPRVLEGSALAQQPVLLLELVSRAETTESLNKALRLLISCVRLNADNLVKMAVCEGYSLLSLLLQRKAHLLDMLSVRAVFDLVGICCDTPQAGALSNELALRDVLLCSNLWEQLDAKMRDSVYKMLCAAITCKYDAFTAARLTQVGAVEKAVEKAAAAAACSALAACLPKDSMALVTSVAIWAWL